MKIASPNNQAYSDAELIAEYKQTGDLEVLAELFQRYSTLVFGVCLKYFKNKEDSKDAVMQLYEKLITGLKKHEVKNFKSWLHVTTRNYCLMELRKKKIHHESFNFENSDSDNMEFSLSLHHDDDNMLEMDLQLLTKCIEKLPLNQNTCIRLFFLEEKSYKEVSIDSGFELNKVKSYIQNGRRNLKNCIEENRVS
jgi:RNA polymerase sigma-70 factor (ECF subfamily)